MRSCFFRGSAARTGSPPSRGRRNESAVRFRRAEGHARAGGHPDRKYCGRRPPPFHHVRRLLRSRRLQREIRSPCSTARLSRGPPARARHAREVGGGGHPDLKQCGRSQVGRLLRSRRTADHGLPWRIQRIRPTSPPSCPTRQVGRLLRSRRMADHGPPWRIQRIRPTTPPSCPTRQVGRLLRSRRTADHGLPARIQRIRPTARARHAREVGGGGHPDLKQCGRRPPPMRSCFFRGCAARTGSPPSRGRRNESAVRFRRAEGHARAGGHPDLKQCGRRPPPLHSRQRREAGRRTTPTAARLLSRHGCPILTTRTREPARNPLE